MKKIRKSFKKKECLSGINLVLSFVLLVALFPLCAYMPAAASSLSEAADEAVIEEPKEKSEEKSGDEPEAELKEDSLLEEEQTGAAETGTSEEEGAEQAENEKDESSSTPQAVQPDYRSNPSVLLNETDQEPEHRKYVEAQSDGSYALSLEVTGDRQSINYPGDVVIIFDVSSSTSSAMLSSFKVAARTLADILLTEENSALPESQQVRIAIVTFSETGKTHANFTSDRTALDASISTINNHPSEIFTNWKGALDYSDSLLSTAANERPTTRKYALFLTDGGPNMRSPNYLSYVDAEASAKNMLNNGITLYTLGVLENNNQGGVFMPYVRLNALEGAGFLQTDYTLNATAGYELATDALAIRTYRFAGRPDEAEGKYFIIHKESDQNYIDAFTAIAREISNQIDFSHITITDTLSSYVDLLNTTDDLGAITDAQVEKIQNGQSFVIEAYSLHYDPGTKTIIFTIDEALEHQTTYRLTLAIRPSQDAFDEYAANRSEGLFPSQEGYPHLGGADTGTTSENMFGFISNESASLTFHTVDKSGSMSEEKTASPFETPVIHVELGSILVKKTWVGDEEHERPESITITLLQDGIPFRSTVLTDSEDSEGWSAIFENIPGGPEGHEYRIQELDVALYDASYMPNSTSYIGLGGITSSLNITNTRQTAQVSFTKISSVYYENRQAHVAALAGAEFELYAWMGQESPLETDLVDSTSIDLGRWSLVGTATSDQNGQVAFSFPVKNSGIYQLVEKTAPKNYQLPHGQWRFSLTPQGAIDTDSIAKIKGADGSTPPSLQIVSTEPFEGELALTNIPNYELPAMGSAGIDIFSTIGISLLLLGAGVYACFAIRQKRKVSIIERNRGKDE